MRSLDQMVPDAVEVGGHPFAEPVDSLMVRTVDAKPVAVQWPQIGIWSAHRRFVTLVRARQHVPCMHPGRSHVLNQRPSEIDVYQLMPPADPEHRLSRPDRRVQIGALQVVQRVTDHHAGPVLASVAGRINIASSRKQQAVKRTGVQPFRVGPHQRLRSQSPHRVNIVINIARQNRNHNPNRSHFPPSFPVTCIRQRPLIRLSAAVLFSLSPRLPRTASPFRRISGVFPSQCP